VNRGLRGNSTTFEFQGVAFVTRAVKEIVAIIVGFLVGLVVLIEGALTFLSGIGRPGVGPYVTARGVVGGNLPLIGGLLLMTFGLAILIGTVSYAVWNWTGGDNDSLGD
jgi:hypothetical protein